MVVQTAAITAEKCTIQLMSVYLVAVITAAETAAKCNMLLAAVVPAVTKNRREMSPDTGIHGRFQTAAQMISRQLEPSLNDLKTAVKCMFSCSVCSKDLLDVEDRLQDQEGHDTGSDTEESPTPSDRLTHIDKEIN